MDILKRIDAQREQYMRITGKQPAYLYLCQNFAQELDMAAGMVVFSYKGMGLVIVDKRNWCSVGDKYTEMEDDI